MTKNPFLRRVINFLGGPRNPNPPPDPWIAESLRRLTMLTVRDQNVALECLKASVFGPFFHEDDFETLIGLDRVEVEKIIEAWPSFEGHEHDAALAINNSILWLLCYDHQKDHLLCDYLSVSLEELIEMFERWCGRKSTAESIYEEFR